MTTRSIVTALGIASLLAMAGPASAQQAKCLAGKTKCMSKKATGLLKCETLAETPGKPTDPNTGGCVTKTKNKFDGTPDPTKGCFEKLENKNPNDCVTLDDTGAAEAAVDSCVGALVAAIDPPPTDQTKCGAGKKKCVSKYLAALLKCQALAQTPGKPTDQSVCIDKATTKYNGGVEPTKGCFAKLQAKSPNDCQSTTDSGTLQGLVEDCVDNLVAAVTASTTTTTTSTTTTTTCPPPGQTIFGALTATPGRFNYNASLGLPGADSFCNAKFACTHACTYPELLTAEAAGELVGLKDFMNNTVASFWVINALPTPDINQCLDDILGGSNRNWEYGTAHTSSRGTSVTLNTGTGALGPVGVPEQCNFSSRSVGCCR